MWQSTPYTAKRLDKSYSTNYGKQTRVDTINTDGKRYPLTVQKFKYDSNKVHPTQKPIELFEYLIRTYTNEGDLVLDNCLGSGTTAVACINTKRNFIGIELSKEYCDIANKRIES
jgi:site-specific DNA-methyltransferase (adenine-specific)